jgi:glucarate dehydratase
VKVARVRTQIVNVPFQEPETWFFGRSWGLTSVVVKVETDDGLLGLGECPGVPNIGAAEDTVQKIGTLLLGRDPHNILSFLRRARMHGWHHFAYLGNAAAASLEIALWDIVGRAAGKPLHELFGGIERDAVPYYFYVCVPDRQPDTARGQAAEAVRNGFKTMYFKVGFDMANDLEIVRAVRDEVGPEIAIRVDANEAWSKFVAVDALRAFEEVGLEFLEQPIDMHDIDGLAYLRRQSRTKIGANQSAWQLHQIRQVLNADAADVIVTDPHQLGGLSVFRDVAGICEAWQVPLVKHSFGDLGITTAATVHLLAGLPEPTLAHQTHLTLLEHDLLTDSFIFQDGNLTVPHGPGLGVEVDVDAVAHYADLWRSVGELATYGDFQSPSPFGGDGHRRDQRRRPVIAGGS